MYSKDDILKQLRNGANASDIAQKMADEINAAVKEYDEEQEKAKLVQQEKRDDAMELIDACAKFFGKYMGTEIGTMSDEEKENAVDSLIELVDHLSQLKNIFNDSNIKSMFDNKSNILPKINMSPAPSAEDDIDDDVLKRFLASL